MKTKDLKEGTYLYKLFMDKVGEFYFEKTYIHPTDNDWEFRDLDWNYYSEEDLVFWFPTKQECIDFAISKLEELK